ncbi:MAG TPA: sulfite exporter TauE/SafE family protein [Alphaproteobacteria bacterium]|nr:sulfite exporter TauE/SafE family protein [Alphaproteobacteria bacterium]
MDLLAGYTLLQLVLLVAGLALTGIVAGILAGLLGVGGGIVIVPVLYHVFSGIGIDEAVRMHLAVGTSLATIVATSMRSMRAHRAKDAVDADLLRGLALPIIAGVLLGSLIAGGVDGGALMAVFAAVALIVAIHMAFGRESWRIADVFPAGVTRAAIGAVIGLISVLMGIGGGTLGVPILNLYNIPIHRAVGTATGFGLIIAVPGTLAMILNGWGAPGLPPFSLGYVNLIGFALIVPTTILAAPWGARIAHAISRPALRRAFAVFLALTSLRMMGDLF